MMTPLVESVEQVQDYRVRLETDWQIYRYRYTIIYVYLLSGT